MNPFDFGMGLTALSQNPELFSQVMSATGASPTGGMGTGFQLGPQAAASAQGLGQMMQPQMAAPAAVPAAAAPAGGGLAALKGIQAPKAPAPLMNAGVSGSAKPGEMTAQKGGSQAIDALMAMIMGRQKQAQPVANLAQLLKGIG